MSGDLSCRTVTGMTIMDERKGLTAEDFRRDAAFPSVAQMIQKRKADAFEKALATHGVTMDNRHLFIGRVNELTHANNLNLSVLTLDGVEICRFEARINTP